VQVSGRLLTLPVLAGGSLSHALLTEPWTTGLVGLKGDYRGGWIFAHFVLFILSRRGHGWCAVDCVCGCAGSWHSMASLQAAALARGCGCDLREPSHFYFQDGWHSASGAGFRWRMVTVVLVAAGLYLIARTPCKNRVPSYLEASAYVHTLLRTRPAGVAGVVRGALWWLAAVLGRVCPDAGAGVFSLKLDELRWQVQALAALTCGRVVTTTCMLPRRFMA